MHATLFTSIILVTCDARTPLVEVEINFNDSYLDASCMRKCNGSVIQTDMEGMDDKIMINSEIPAWIAAISHEKELFSVLHQIALQINKQRVRESKFDVSFSIIIHSIKVHEITNLARTDNHAVSIILLELMHDWYNYVPNGETTWHRCTIEDLLCLLWSTEQTNINTLQIMYDSLKDVFPIQKAYHLFYQWMYYEPYISLLSDNRLKFISHLGEGSQANVIKVSDGNKHYALKIFYQTCETQIIEQQILLRIETLIQNKKPNKRIDNIRIARIAVQDQIELNLNINYAKHKALLLTFVDAKPLSQIQAFNTKDAKIMLKELQFISKWLINHGISHDDYNEDNILRDINGNYWVIDFGLGKYLNTENELKYYKHPFIGTWLFYSPSTFNLSRWLQKEINQSGQHTITIHDRQRWNEQVLNAHLYSAQAIAAHKLLQQDYKTRPLVALFRRLHAEIQELWNRQGYFSEDIEARLDKIWRLRRAWCRILTEL